MDLYHKTKTKMNMKKSLLFIVLSMLSLSAMAQNADSIRLVTANRKGFSMPGDARICGGKG